MLARWTTDAKDAERMLIIGPWQTAESLFQLMM
jgi:hypothetical protein